MEKEINYNMINDIRFPVELLHKGFYLLKSSQKAFLDYAMDVGMPSQDIERVMNKLKYQTDPNFRAEIRKLYSGIRKQLRGSDFEIKQEELDEVPF